MAEMVRKQIYIEERHERLLKRISKARGVSEAELIRQAIERETVGEKPLLSPDQEAWDKILCLRRAGKPFVPVLGITDGTAWTPMRREEDTSLSSKKANDDAAHIDRHKPPDFPLRSKPT